MKTVDALACEFAITLRGWLTAAEWQDMCETNALHTANGRDGICASHDFCDANEAMAVAFATIVGRDADVLSSDDNAIWNEAWERSKLQFLTA